MPGSSMNFQQVPFTDAIWRTLSIEGYLKKSKDKTTAEQYYQHLATGLSFLITGEGKDFIIISMPANDTIWVHAAYCESGDFYEKYLADWIKFWIKPKFPSVTCIKWNSQRTAYLKGIPKFGDYVVESVTYKKVIT